MWVPSGSVAVSAQTDAFAGLFQNLHGVPHDRRHPTSEGDQVNDGHLDRCGLCRGLNYGNLWDSAFAVDRSRRSLSHFPSLLYSTLLVGLVQGPNRLRGAALTSRISYALRRSRCCGWWAPSALSGYAYPMPRPSQASADRPEFSSDPMRRISSGSFLCMKRNA